MQEPVQKLETFDMEAMLSKRGRSEQVKNAKTSLHPNDEKSDLVAPESLNFLSQQGQLTPHDINAIYERICANKAPQVKVQVNGAKEDPLKRTNGISLNEDGTIYRIPSPNEYLPVLKTLEDWYDFSASDPGHEFEDMTEKDL